MTGECPVEGCTRKPRNGRDNDLCGIHYKARRNAALAALRAGQDCTMCGTPHRTAKGGRACYGHQPRTLKPCSKPPIDGLEVCGTHGPNQSVRRAGEQRVAEEQIIAQARKLIPDAADRTPITNPLEKLLELASEADAFRESLRLMANELDRIRYTGIAGGEQLRAEVATYRVAMKDTTDLLVAIAKLDIDQRMAQHAVARDDLYLKVLTAILHEFGHDLTEPDVAAKVERHLRAV